jgi:NADPH:quinone reductase
LEALLTNVQGAATLPVNTIAAFACLFHEKGLNIPAPFSGFDSAKSTSFPYSSTTVLIIGAGSAAGKLGVRFASMAHIGQIIAVASSKNEAELRELGATHVVDRNSTDLVQEIRKLVADDLIYVVDNVNGGDGGLDLAVQILSNTKKGHVVSLLPSSPSEAVAAAKPAGYEAGFMLAASRMLGDLAVKFWNLVPEWLANGDIKTFPFQVIEGLDVEKINGVLDRYRDGKGVAPKVNIHI